ncbi:MAG: hypothetical protein ACTSUT_01850 [Promethearchaeota archaeon]
MKNDKEIKDLLFIDEDNCSEIMMRQFAEKVIKYAKITKRGDIIFLNNTLSQDDKLRLSIVLKFIAHTFDNNILETITLKEVSELLSERIEAVGSRLSKAIKEENFAKKIKKGVYKVQYFVIDKFLTDLENRMQNIGNTKKGITKNGKKRKDKSVTGVGKDVLELMNDNFFKTPKTVREVCEKLKEEIKFHDQRIVDTTIRKTFVKNKKLLKRIPNTEKGKAKWLYVIRKN